MKLGVGVPNVGEFADPILLVDLAAAAEGAGWDGFFLWDHLLYRPPRPGAVEPWTVIAAIAAATERMHIGVLMTAVPRRQPALLAQQVATVDLLSGGRVIFGAGLGSMPEEYAAFGDPATPAERASRLDEALPLLQSLWGPGPVTHHGPSFTVDGVDLLPRPQQRPHPPIWVAGRWPNTAPFRRAARFDGVMPTHVDHPHGSFMTPPQLAEAVAYVERHRTRTSPFDVVMEGESDDADRLAAIAPRYEAVGLTWWIEKLGWWRGSTGAAMQRVMAGPPA